MEKLGGVARRVQVRLPGFTDRDLHGSGGLDRNHLGGVGSYGGIVSGMRLIHVGFLAEQRMKTRCFVTEITVICVLLKS